MTAAERGTLLKFDCNNMIARENKYSLKIVFLIELPQSFLVICNGFGKHRCWPADSSVRSENASTVCVVTEGMDKHVLLFNLKDLKLEIYFFRLQ